MRGVELFAGGGGLALGAEAAGVRHAMLVERDVPACATLRANRPGWRVEVADVRDVDWSFMAGVDVLSGGPPCQPFSTGGKARGSLDARDMWPETLRALDAIRPKGFVFENVRGLLRPRFAGYAAWIAAALARPGTPRRPGEDVEGHARRLAERGSPPEYRVSMVALDAADYGVPQRRGRVLFMGVRSDLDVEAPRLAPTHSRARLLHDQWIDGSYWDRVGMDPPDRCRMPPLDAPAVESLARAGARPEGLPWRTVREALRGLGEPDGIDGHVFQPGARSYKGHTGSPLDAPAKAIKAGDHGVPGGENMLVADDGSVRYFSTREAACLQGFPTDWSFRASWGVNLRQIGNAVPVPVATAAFAALARAIASSRSARTRDVGVARTGTLG